MRCEWSSRIELVLMGYEDAQISLFAHRVGQEPFGPFPPSEPYMTVSRHTAQALQSNLPLGITGCPNAPGRKYGVSTFRVSDNYGGDVGPFCTPAALCPRRGTATSPDRLHTFWSKPLSLIWLAPLDGASERSLALTISP